MTRPLLVLLLGAVAAPAALAQPNPDAEPEAGTVALESGFSPDPHAVDLTAGSGMEAASASSECAGYVSVAPSVVLDYQGSTDLPLYLFVRSSSDTVLLVQAPGGAWLCNDDEGSSNPGLYIESPERGRYVVWVGLYSDMGGTDVPATLYASERDAPPPLDPEGTPGASPVALDAGFTPDPHEMSVSVGGSISANAYEGCAGFVDAAAPSAVLNYDTDGSGALYVYAQTESDDDLTLVVMGPDEAVHCNDDAADLNPGLVIEPAVEGRYAVWVGSYSARARTEAPARAALFFSATEGPVADYMGEEYEEYEDGVYEGGEDISRFAAPAHGTLTLAPGFASETVQVQAGGTDAVSVIGSGCAGFIANGEPDLNVLYDGDGSLVFYVEAEDDTTLLVNLPDGSWLCSDDAPEMERNPAVELEAAEGGLYNVWVGTYSQEGPGPPATLHVAEHLPR